MEEAQRSSPHRSGEAWFALRVRPRHEKSVSSALAQMSYEEFLPLYRGMRKWSDRFQPVDIPLFPGYVFSRFPVHDRFPILALPGVLHLVSVGKTPIPVEEGEITALQLVQESGLLMQPWPFLRVGQRVRIEDGPLRNVEGILTGIKDSCQVVLSITLLQRSVAVSVPREWIRPLTSVQYSLIAS